MGWFSQDTRMIEGEVFIIQGEFQNKGDAIAWQKEYHSGGFKCHVIPNAKKQMYEVWVSEQPTYAPPKV